MTGDCASRQLKRLLHTGGLLCGLLLLGSSRPPLTAGGDSAEAGDHVWNPLQQQFREPDTLFLLDADHERQLRPGAGGLIPVQAAMNAPWTRVVPVPGKFRRGLKCLNRDSGYLWMPCLGLIDPREFTIELWLKCARPWAEVYKNWPLLLRDDNHTVDLRLCVHGGWLTLGYSHLQDPRGPVQAQIHYDVLDHPLPAGVWVSLAITFHQGALKLYVTGAQAGAVTGLRPPQVWSDCANYDGLCLLGGFARGADQFALSELRISRHARVPGQIPATDNAHTLTVDLRAPTGQSVNRNLLGSLHYLQGPRSERMAARVLAVMRTDKLVSATPIKAGSPDAQHPVSGVSGRYAYDWQVVDRTLDYYRRLHVMPYLSIDATPQLLGGSIPPFQGQSLATAKSGESDFPDQVPRDLEAFGTMVRDLVYHVVRERQCRVPYWGVWNEPDGYYFWAGSFDQYLALYDVCARAVKSVDARLKVGGPETGYDGARLEALIRHCAASRVPLDFVSWHYYSGNVGELPRARAQVDDWCRQSGLAAGLPLLVGEWCGPGEYGLWSNPNYALSDRHAAFVGASLVEMQRAGAVLGIYTVPVTNAGGGGRRLEGGDAPLGQPQCLWIVGEASPAATADAV